MQIVVFEDEHVWRLHPITIGRAAYSIGCGSFRLVDWLRRLSRDVGAGLHGVVRPHLGPIQKLDFPELSTQPLENQPPLLVVNARLVPSVAVYRALERLIKRGETVAVLGNRLLAAAMIYHG